MGIGSGGAGHLLQFQCTNIVQVISIPQKPMSDLLMVMKIQDAAKVSKKGTQKFNGGGWFGYGGWFRMACILMNILWPPKAASAVYN